MSNLRPSSTRPLQAPLALHIEVIAWFAATIPPSSNRTVIVRIAGQAGTWPAFYDPKQRAWFSTHDGCEIEAEILCWAEQPIGASNERQIRATDDVVAKLTKTPQGYFSLKFTAAGKALPAGDFELRLGDLPFTQAFRRKA